MGEPLRTEDVTAFSACAEWTGVRAEEHEAWLAARKELLTASDMAAILGEDEHRTAIEVYIDKVSTQPENPVLALDDPRFWGRVLEQPVLRALATYRGWKYRKGGALLRSRKHPFLGATLDAEIDRGDGMWIDLEGKTTRLPRGWDEETGQLPTRVLIQVQSQLLVTGAELAIVFALLQGSRPVQIPIEPSPKFHAVLVERGEEFMDMVRQGIVPVPDGSPASARALTRLYPKANGAAVMLPPEALEWTRKCQKLSLGKRLVENRLRYYQQLLKHSIGEATYGVLPEPVGGKNCWRWETQAREGFVVEPTETRVLVPLKARPSTRGTLPPGRPDAVLDALTRSVETDDIAPIRFGKARRRSAR